MDFSNYVISFLAELLPQSCQYSLHELGGVVSTFVVTQCLSVSALNYVYLNNTREKQ